MKHVELARKTKSSSHWTRLAAVSLLAVAALAGCGGGSDGAPGAPGVAGTDGVDGTDGKDLTATVSLATMSATDWANLTPVGTVTGVEINSPPVVSFKVVDGYSRPVVGLTTSQLRFAIAKLVPGANGSPSNWVSYIVGDPTTGAPSRPSTENVAANLIDNKDGTYKYTFARDITGPLQTKIAEWFGDAATKANGTTTYAKADVLGVDGKLLDYAPALTHRLAIQLSGTAVGSTLKNPINVIYDFVPATKAVVTTGGRDIVDAASCSECHGTNFGTTPHAGRVDTRYCAVCHTDQRKAGRANSVATNSDFGTTVNTAGLTVPNTVYRVNDKSWGDLPTMVHKIHAGKYLTLKNSNYVGIDFAEVTYPQPATNCTKCHDAAKAPQGDNWKNAPSIKACGSCHDGIDFATGIGTGIKGATKHAGGAANSDATCATCHNTSTLDIKLSHVTVDPTGANGRGGYPLNTALDFPTPGYPSGQGPAVPLASQLNMPAGVYKIGLEIQKATLAGAAGARKVTVVYRVLKNGAPVTLSTTPVASCPTPPYTAKYYTACLIDGVDGTPDIYLAYGVPQDGAPTDGSTVVDWNATQSVHVSDIVGTQGAPDANGWYTAVINKIIPDNAKMVTAGLGINYNGFVQVNNPAYKQGIRLREPAFAMMTATSTATTGFPANAARRTVVDNAKCNSCHGQLGVEPSFHSGARNNGAGCAMCHQPDTATGHVGASYAYGGGWSVQSKNLIHSIHASSKRAQAFTYEASAEHPLGLSEVTYPGVGNKCEQCHVAGSYDFSTTANKNAAPNLLWTTDAKGDMSAVPPDGTTVYGLSPWVKTLGEGLADFSNATGTVGNLVSSPISATCFGCHDSAISVAHILANNGTLVTRASKVTVSGTKDRTKGFAKQETCLVCHASGRDADIKVVHSK